MPLVRYELNSNEIAPAWLKEYLDEQADLYNTAAFIPYDPISLPHRFSDRADIEVAGFFAATFAWGQRKTILAKGAELLAAMGDEPHRFVLEASEDDLGSLSDFRHRTFCGEDAYYFVGLLRRVYQEFGSMEACFAHFAGEAQHQEAFGRVGAALAGFYAYFFQDQPLSLRTRKHVATPLRGSACKRLNMYLRWMVRQDERRVDFGIWRQSFTMAELICPTDVHVLRVAKALGMVEAEVNNWAVAQALTERLRAFDPVDPVRYDYALFGIGVMGERQVLARP